MIMFYLGGGVSKVPSHLKEVPEGQRREAPSAHSLQVAQTRRWPRSHPPHAMYVRY